MRTTKSKRRPRKYTKKGGNNKEYELIGRLNIPNFIDVHVYFSNHDYDNDKKLMCAEQLLKNIENENIYTYVLLINLRPHLNYNNDILYYFSNMTVYPKMISREPSLESLGSPSIRLDLTFSKSYQAALAMEIYLDKIKRKVANQRPSEELAVGGI